MLILLQIILSFALAAVSATYLGAPLAAAPIVAAPVAKAYGGYGLGAYSGYGLGAGYGHGLGAGAGYGYGLGAGAGYGYGHYGYPLATSYANTYKVSNSVPVVKTVAAPVVASPYGYDLGLGYGAYGSGLAYGHGLY